MATIGSGAVDPSLCSPRILCLHGGGVNGDIFRLQARALIARLSPTFRFVFANAPFLCDPHPDILPVYADLGPYRRWLRWQPQDPAIDARLAVDKIDSQLHAAMHEDTAEGASGPWVGLMGFSQGARISASLLFDQQARLTATRRDDTEALVKLVTEWKFGILLAGSAPLVSLSEYTADWMCSVNAAEMSENSVNARGGAGTKRGAQRQTLRIPTVHVYGVQDQLIHQHRRLSEEVDEDTMTLVEWHGGHRVPVQPLEVESIVKATINVARKTGVIP